VSGREFSPIRVGFAVPGDITKQTGGYRYDREMMLQLQQMGFDVIHLALADSFPFPSNQDQHDAAKAFGELDVDIVVIDGLAYGVLDQKTLVAIDVPIIALVHHPLAFEGGLQEDLRAALLESERLNLTLAKHVVVTSNHTATLLSEEYQVPKEKLSVAAPGFAKNTSASRVSTPPLILSVGIQVRRKGHDVLIRALAEIADLKWQAKIVGAPLDADYSEELRALIEELKLEDRVELLGQLDFDELQQLYPKASIFALATRYEGYGMVFGEAMLHALPIITTNTGAVAETVSGAGALLVEPDDPAALAAELRRTLTDPQLRASLVAASSAAGESLPSWEQSAAILAEVLKAAVQEEDS
jgi:glycosyltransferase involved in cell wall biosynthesis